MTGAVLHNHERIIVIAKTTVEQLTWPDFKTVACKQLVWLQPLSGRHR